MTRVLMLNYEFPPVGGGGGVAAKAIAEALVEGGHKVDYVTSRYPGQPKHECIEGINVYRVRVGRRNKSTASLRSMLAYPLSGFQKCVRLCQQHDYDVINTHFAIPSGPLGAAISRIFNIRHVVSIHGGDIHDPTKELSPHKKWYLRKVVSWILNDANRVIAQSSDTRTNALEYYEIKTEQTIDIQPFPYEPFEFKPVSRSTLGLKDDIKYIVSIGRLVERKGYRYLIEAVARLNRDVEALIIGEGPERTALEAFAAEIGVSDRIHFQGYVSEERKFQYLDCSDVYVLSSIHEGFGIVIQEAMQTGLPIVATESGGQTDIIKDGTHGRIIPTRDSEALARAVREVIESDADLYEKRNTSRLEDFTPAQVRESYLRSLSLAGD